MPRQHLYSTHPLRTAAPERNHDEPGLLQRRALILVVDDEPDTVDILNWLLLGEGFDVRTARSGREALRSVAERIPDVAIIDYMMPEMNGIALCHLLRDQPSTRHVPIILHTAFANPAIHRDRCFDRVVPKPTEFDDLIKEVRALLQRSQ